VALCAHLAATFVTSRLERASRPTLADHFRRRGLQTGASLLALGLLALLTAAWKAPALWHRLSTAALPLLVIGLLATVLSLYALARRHFQLARGATMLAAGAIVWGWLIAQSPRLIGTQLTIHTAAATHAALSAIAIAVAAVLIAVLPALSALRPVRAPGTGDDPMKPLLAKTLKERRLNLAAGALILWVALGPWVWGYATSPAAVASHVSSSSPSDHSPS
jgi:cytochrome bd ubiquinol oxidase subunit II